jgi:hypothetical protein
MTFLITIIHTKSAAQSEEVKKFWKGVEIKRLELEERLKQMEINLAKVCDSCRYLFLSHGDLITKDFVTVLSILMKAALAFVFLQLEFIADRLKMGNEAHMIQDRIRLEYMSELAGFETDSKVCIIYL